MKKLKTISQATLAGIAFSIVGSILPADALILVPPGLNPGDQYRLVFVTSTERDATSSNINDYNSFVNNTANTVPELAVLGTTWKAIASTATVNAIDNTMTTGIGVPLFRLDGIKVADNYSDLWDGSINAPIGIIEDGGLKICGIGCVWTGTIPTGRVGASLGVGFPTRGRPGSVNGEWVQSGNFSFCSSVDCEFSFYGISSRLVVPGATAVPEPTNSLLSFIILGGSVLGSSVLRTWKNKT